MMIPLHDNILVMGQDDPDTWHGTMLIRPESTKERCDQGWVKAIGPHVKSVQVGDYVMFSPYSGTVSNVTDEGSKIICIAERGVIAILTPPTSEVEGLFVKTDGGFIPATAETAMMLVRMTYHKLPRVAEILTKGVSV